MLAGHDPPNYLLYGALREGTRTCTCTSLFCKEMYCCFTLASAGHKRERERERERERLVCCFVLHQRVTSATNVCLRVKAPCVVICVDCPQTPHSDTCASQLFKTTIITDKKILMLPSNVTRERLSRKVTESF
jgi:hypothetical protein